MTDADKFAPGVCEAITAVKVLHHGALRQASLKQQFTPAYQKTGQVHPTVNQLRARPAGANTSVLNNEYRRSIRVDPVAPKCIFEVINPRPRAVGGPFRWVRQRRTSIAP